MDSGQGGGDVIIFLGCIRKMKDDVRLIFSLIRQQTEMEGGEQEVGGWALHYRDQQGLKKEGTGIWETKASSTVGRKMLRKKRGERTSRMLY